MDVPPVTVDLLPVVNGILGVVIPFVIHLIRLKILPWSGKAATWLTFLIAAGVTAFAYFQVDTTPTFLEALPQISTVFTVATLVHSLLKNQLNPDK